MPNRSAHQERIIRNYYEHREDLMLQKLGELVADLYLADGKSRKKLWERVATALKNLKMPQTQIDHIVQSDNPSLLASRLEEMLKKAN